MKKLMIITASVAAMAVIAFGEYVTMPVGDRPVRLASDAKVVALDVISTDATAAVAVSVIRAINSYTNFVDVVLVTNGIGEISTVTNRSFVLKEAKVYTNALGSVTCSGGTGRADIGKFIFGGDAVVATGITNESETVKAKLIIEK